jgi:hypothetical protein
MHTPITVAATMILAIALMLTALAARAVAADNEALDDCVLAPNKAAEKYCLTHGGAAPPDDPPRVRARFVPPLPRVWQCNDIRVTETVLQPGIVNYDLGGTIWGGSQFTLNINQGNLYFNGRPCYRYR